jgi:sulfofructose kinase
MKKWDILGVGTAAVDDQLYVERFPRPDEKMRVQSTCRQPGGQTATALVAAARQGARTAFFSRLGEDSLSQYTVAELEKEQVDCSLVQYNNECRPYHTTIIVDQSAHSRTILYSAEGVTEPDMGAFNPIWIEQSRVVFIDHNIPHAILHAARLARSAGVPVVADIESTIISGLAELLPLVDHLIVSRDFAWRLTGETEIPEMLSALAHTPRTATVITWGKQGCWYTTGKGCQHVPAIEVKVVDTTGCGDVFHGTYAAAIARGEEIPHAIHIATTSAGLKATKPGGRPGIPTLAEVESLLAETE